MNSVQQRPNTASHTQQPIPVSLATLACARRVVEGKLLDVADTVCNATRCVCDVPCCYAATRMEASGYGRGKDRVRRCDAVQEGGPTTQRLIKMGDFGSAKLTLGKQSIYPERLI